MTDQRQNAAWLEVPLRVLAFLAVAGLAAVTLTPREEEPQIVVPMIDVMVIFPLTDGYGMTARGAFQIAARVHRGGGLVGVELRDRPVGPWRLERRDLGGEAAVGLAHRHRRLTDR